jgi:hypothetical protein
MYINNIQSGQHVITCYKPNHCLILHVLEEKIKLMLLLFKVFM